MQAISDLWKTTIGKLAIIGGGGMVGLISLCFVCTICNALVGSNDTAQDVASKPTEVAVKTLPAEIVEPESTATPTEPLPTNTPTSLPPTETPVPTPTEAPPTEIPPTEVLEPVILAGDSNINLRSGPGTDYETVGILGSGGSLKIVGRNADSSWWQVSASEGLAWVAASVVTANNVDDSIPVVEAPPAPIQSTSTPLPSPTELSPTEQQPPVASDDSAVEPSDGSTGGTPFQCVGGCATPPDPACAIKGNVNSRGEKIYHVPGGQFYDRTDIKPKEGDRWFCTEEEARNAGFRASER